MENNIKNTAFEWYIEQHNIIAELGNNISVAERFKRFSDIVTQAKEIEKKQIIDACLAGGNGVSYYKETYGNNNHK